jgi:hypothetical protein
MLRRMTIVLVLVFFHIFTNAVYNTVNTLIPVVYETETKFLSKAVHFQNNLAQFNSVL